LSDFSGFGYGFGRRQEFQIGLFRSAMMAMVQQRDARSLLVNP
jgi:hypothetical protein